MPTSDELASLQIDRLLDDCSAAYNIKKVAEYNKRKILAAAVSMLFSSANEKKEVIERISVITEIKIETVEKIISEAIDSSRAERP